MAEHELNDIISKLEQSGQRSEPVFGIYFLNDDHDNCFIKANEEGMQAIALQFLRAAKEINEGPVEGESTTIQLNLRPPLVDSDSHVNILFVEPVTWPVQNTSETSTVADNLLPIGCVALLVFLAVSLIIGLITIADWIF